MTSTRTSKIILGIGVVVLSLVTAVAAALLAAGDDDPGAAPGTGDEVGRFVEPGDNPLLSSRDAAGEPLPAVSFEMLDGSASSFEAYAGRPLVLNFFASWCPPCVAEMPAFEQVHRRLGNEVGFLGLAVRDTVRDATAIVEKTGITYDAGRDPRGRIFAEFGAFAMPSTVFISADGKILEVRGGELSEKELQRKIEELLLA